MEKKKDIRFREVRGLLLRYLNSANCLIGDMVAKDPDVIGTPEYIRKIAQKDLLEKILRNVEKIEQS